MEQFSIKHRPKQFAELFGQDSIKKDLIKRSSTGNWPRAMLLKGQFGTGKTTAAHIIAMTLQCTNPGKDHAPCGECNSCKSILNERFDRDTVMLDGSQIGQKDSIIEFTSTVGIRPMYDKNRIFIIEEADQLSNGASNALLKILEAPQDNVYFMLLSMVANGVSPAIQSRCQTFNFKPISVKDTMLAMRAVLEKEQLWSTIPDEFKMQGLAAIASSSKGSLREAMQLLERCLIGEYYTAEAIHENLGIVDEAATYKLLDGLLALTKDETIWNTIYTSDPAELFNYFTLVLADAMICKMTGFVKNELYAHNTRALAAHPSVEALFTTLTEYPQLTKPYTRKADLLSALASYYSKNSPKAALPVRVVRKPV